MAQAKEPVRAARRQGIVPMDVQRCIEACLDCHRVCLTMSSQHCLVHGGEHVAPAHFRLMMVCAEMCRTAASVMMIGSDQMGRVCGACAAICDDCADSCDALDGMAACVEACRRCADACREMAT
jgi:hypothetical protein